jgi:hypothetical protein
VAKLGGDNLRIDPELIHQRTMRSPHRGSVRAKSRAGKRHSTSRNSKKEDWNPAALRDIPYGKRKPILSKHLSMNVRWICGLGGEKFL